MKDLHVLAIASGDNFLCKTLRIAGKETEEESDWRRDSTIFELRRSKCGRGVIGASGPDSERVDIGVVVIRRRRRGETGGASPDLVSSKGGSAVIKLSGVVTRFRGAVSEWSAGSDAGNIPGGLGDGV